MVAFGVFGAFWGGWAAAIPDLKEAVGASDSEFGLALLGVGVGALPAMLAMGPIYDRHGDRTTAPLLILFAATALLPGISTSVPSLFAILILLGAMSGMLDIAINAATTEWESSSGRRLLNLAHASFSGFFLLSSVLVGLARRAGTDHAAILVCLAVIVALAAPLNRVPRVGVRMRDEGRRLRLEPRFLMLGALCGLAFVVEGGLESWSAVHLERTFEASPAVGGLGPGLFAAAMVTGRMLGHVIEGHAGPRAILSTGSTLAAVGLAGAAAAPTTAAALAGFVCAGLGTSVAAPTLFGLAGRGVTARQRGSAMSTVTTVAYLGFLLGPPMVGWISGASSLRIGLGFLAVASVSLAVLSGLLISRSSAFPRPPAPG